MAIFVTRHAACSGTEIAQQLVITFDELLRRTPFAELHAQASCSLLEKHYQTPVDMEFTVANR